VTMHASPPGRVIGGSRLAPYPPRAMRRPPHGGTTRPGPTRPASGYGRRAGRPGPTSAIAREARAHREWWEHAVELAPAAENPAGPVEAQV
jgi:hypothetical protein